MGFGVGSGLGQRESCLDRLDEEPQTQPEPLSRTNPNPYINPTRTPIPTQPEFLPTRTPNPDHGRVAWIASMMNGMSVAKSCRESRHDVHAMLHMVVPYHPTVHYDITLLP